MLGYLDDGPLGRRNEWGFDRWQLKMGGQMLGDILSTLLGGLIGDQLSEKKAQKQAAKRVDDLSQRLEVRAPCAMRSLHGSSTRWQQGELVLSSDYAYWTAPGTSLKRQKLPLDRLHLGTVRDASGREAWSVNTNYRILPIEYEGKRVELAARESDLSALIQVVRSALGT